MKKVFLTVCILAGCVVAAMDARASTDVQVSFSSGLVSGVQCSTDTATRIDNWNRGVQSGVIALPRMGIIVQNLDTAYNAWVSVDPVKLSSVSTSGFVGTVIEPGGTAYIGANQGLAVRCVTVDAAGVNGVRLHVTQVAKP